MDTLSACRSSTDWIQQGGLEPVTATRHCRKSSFGVDQFKASHHAGPTHFDPLSSSFQSSDMQGAAKYGNGSLFAPDMNAPPPLKPLFGPNMVPVTLQQAARTPSNATGNSTDSGEVFTPCMSSPGTILSSQVASEGISTRIPSMPSTGRTISGMFRACVADTLGFGSGNAVRI
jgi:hypothetical protein